MQKKLLISLLLASVLLFLSGCVTTAPVCGDGICTSEKANVDSPYFCPQDCGIEQIQEQDGQESLGATSKDRPPCHKWNSDKKEWENICNTMQICCNDSCFFRESGTCCNDNPTGEQYFIGSGFTCCGGYAAGSPSRYVPPHLKRPETICCKNPEGYGFLCNKDNEVCGTNSCKPKGCTTDSDCGDPYCDAFADTGYAGQNRFIPSCNQQTGECEVEFRPCTGGQTCSGGECS